MKHCGATLGKKLSCPAHSALMFQPNVGMPAFASSGAPVNSSVAMNAAYTWSWSSIAWTWFWLLTVLSSRLLTSFSWRP